MKTAEIKYIKNKDIDMILWNKCISRAQNGDVFGYSWYLDAVCLEWDALIVGDYQAVFPIPINKIAGIKGMNYPLFFNKSNLYISKDIDSGLSSDFLKNLPLKFFNFNSENQTLVNKIYKFSEKNSYRLDLISSYRSIQKLYSEFIKDQLKITKQNKIFYNTGILPNGLVLLAAVTDKLSKKAQSKLRVLSSLSLRKNIGETYGAFNDKNRLIAAVLFIRSHYKINVIVAYQSGEAKKKRALYGLIDYYIKTHSEKAITLDFFGLNSMPLDFYKGIGAKEYPYYNIRKRFLF